MNVEMMKKHIEINSLFMEYMAEFIEWVENNKNSPEAMFNYTDKWNGSTHSSAEECDCLEEKKDLPIIEFDIMYFFSDNRFPTMRILNNGNEVYRVLFTDNKMDICIKDIISIPGL